MSKVKKKVQLSICTCPNYSTSFVQEFKEKNKDWNHYNDAIYLNHYRIDGPRDYDGQIIFSTETCGKSGIDTLYILRALGIPDNIIEQIEFED